MPRNPYLHHRYWVADARRAWADGTKTVLALCGEPMDLDYDPDGPEKDDRVPNALIEPAEVREDQEYEDPNTGLWWMEMDCVDCLRIANDLRRSRQLRENFERIRKLFETITYGCLTLDDSRELRAVLEKIASERGCERH